jgi:hypothetical protein
LSRSILADDVHGRTLRPLNDSLAWNNDGAGERDAANDDPDELARQKSAVRIRKNGARLNPSGLGINPSGRDVDLSHLGVHGSVAEMQFG